MDRIYKYPIRIQDRIELRLPVNHVIVLVGSQGANSFMWVKGDVDGPSADFRFGIVGTGHPIGDDLLDFIASWQAPLFVWHLFGAK